MKKILFNTLLLLLISLFTACSNKNVNISKKNTNSYVNNKEYKNINISQALLSHYKQWQGVKYKYGGNTKNGIDCSYFVQDAINSYFDKSIPRTTLYQSKLGVQINKSSLETGDLVFFITSKKGGRHVGIYLDYGDFMHVSTSRGVMISSLNNPYWSKHYWKSKRIFEK